jgi:DNA polymerase-3 subunit beta
MRVTVDRDAIAGALAMAQKYVPNRSTIPVLTTVLLEAADDAVTLTATDLDRVFTTSVEAKVETAGATAAEAALLTGFAKGAAGDSLDMNLDGSLLRVRCGRASGRIPTIVAGDFPKVFDKRTADAAFDMDAAALAEMAKAVGYAASEEESRVYLQGVSWAVHGGRLEHAATDGRFLSWSTMDLPAGASGLKPAIVPAFPVPAFTGAVRIEFSERCVHFAGTLGDRPASVTSRLIDGTFPDYHRIVRPATETATVERRALADAVARCLPVCATERTPIDLAHDIEGDLVVRAHGKDGAEVETVVEVSGSLFAVTLGAEMLRATLASFTSEMITLGFSGVGEAVTFTRPGDRDRLALIMPVSGRLTQRIGPPRDVAA